MKRLLSVLLTATLVLSVVTSCGQGTAGQTTSDSLTTDSLTDTEAVETRDSLPDNLDFDGKTITFYVDKMCTLPEYNCEQTGDIVDDAVYKRNIDVQERLNVSFEFVEAESSWSDNLASFCNPLQNSILAGDAAYDIVAGYGVSIGNLASNMLFTDLCATRYIDFDQPWWPDSLMDDLAVNGRLFFASGDISTNMVGTMFSVMFNKQLLADYQLASPYELVDNNKWTLDTLFSLTKDIYKDVNNNGSKDIDDFFGLAAQVTSIDNLYYSCGMNIIEQDKEKGMVISSDFGSEKMVALVEKLCDAFHNSDSRYLDEEDVLFDVFESGRSVFILAGIRSALTKLRDSSFDYGVVPTPKWDEKQDAYHTTIAYTGSLYAIPRDIADTDAASAVMEALAVEGYYYLAPAFFETAMKVKYSSDEDSARMFDIMKESLSFDFGRVFSTGKFNSIPGRIRSMVVGNNTNWMSAYEGFISQFEASLVKCVEEFTAS